MPQAKESLILFFSLFTSLSTIFCCALPIILVSLGAGAVFASLSTNFPFINILAEKSIYIFAAAFILLLIGGYFIFFGKQICPADKKLAKICTKTKIINKWIWFISFFILLTAFFFKYILILFI